MSSDSKPYRDAEWLREKYHGEELTQREVAEEAGCSKITIRRWMDRLDVPRRSLSESNAEGDVAKLRDEEWLREHYHGKDMSARQIGKQINSSSECVNRWIDRHGIRKKHRSEIMSDGDVRKLHDSEWLRKQYVEKQRPAPDIADECAVDSMTVYSWLEKHDIQIRHVAETRSTGDVAKLMDKDWLKEKYVDDKLSSRKIGSLTDTSKSSVLTWLEIHGIERRPKTPTGKDHHWWVDGNTDYFGPNWEEQRLKARIRDQARCQVCGMSDKEHVEEYGRINHVHHIEPRRKFLDEDGMLDYKAANRLQNLITLCIPHHKKLEGLPIDNREI